MGNLEGKVAFITGAARGQGRSHAVRLAQEGADIIAVDICEDIANMPYSMGTEDDLQETVLQVEAHDRQIRTFKADVRDRESLEAAFLAGSEELGGVDIVLANAGVATLTLNPHASDWYDVLNINLTGVYHTVDIAVPQMIEQGRGGSIVLTSSTAGLIGIGGNTPGGLAYTASKHGLVGLMRAYANYLAPHNIRVNTVHPTGIGTPMVAGPAAQEWLAAAGDNTLTNALPVGLIEEIDISNAIAWLVSDHARYVTGVTLPVDAGCVNKA
ncbi:mycofactocin-coupled SDR family oxidoreductase [Leucobacter sp. W1038]|uniref:mycofactocin-coupled SDR family oxidoreductase n=1 Tax=Leucobacter sp. W1038 TaxID=3438281 RepID=UPI003D965408